MKTGLLTLATLALLAMGGNAKAEDWKADYHSCFAKLYQMDIRKDTLSHALEIQADAARKFCLRFYDAGQQPATKELAKIEGAVFAAVDKKLGRKVPMD